MEITYARTKKLERAYVDVAERAFKKDSQFSEHKLLWLKRPRYKPEQTRIIIDEGEVVAGVAIVELPVRYGDTTLKLGGISCVATDPTKQGRGYGRMNMDDVVQFQKDDGYDISFLLGISNYYHRFGYRTALAWAPIDVNLRSQAPAMPKGWKARKMRRADIPAMDAVYRESIGKCDLSVVRERADWDWYFTFHRMGRDTDRVVLNPEGEVVGYCTIEPKGRLRVAEIGVGDDTTAMDALLAAMKEVGLQNYAPSADIFAVPDSPLANYLYYEKHATKTIMTDNGGGPMFRLFNTETLFGKITSTLEKRWSDAPRSTPEEAITISSLDGTVALVPSGNTLAVKPGASEGTVVEITDEALAEMVLGYRTVTDILQHDGIEAPEAAVSILSALFPPQIPFMPPTDHM